MSIQDQKTFLSNIHPFQVLSSQEMETCIKHMDIAYYPKNSILINPEKIPNCFFIIIKGSVYEYSSDDIVLMDYQHQDSFDSNSLIYGKCTNTFKVFEDLICYEIEKNTFLKLIELNQQFKDYFLNDLVDKIQSLKEKEYTSELSSFMISKVEDTLIHEACIVDENTKLIDAIEKSMEYKTSSIIVKNENNQYGIITDSLLKIKVLLEGRDLSILVKDIAIVQKDPDASPVEIPDAVLRALCISNGWALPIDDTKCIILEEGLNATSFSNTSYSNQIKDLTGIEYFPNLTSLRLGYCSNMKKLDISGLHKVSSLTFNSPTICEEYNLGDNPITSFNAGGSYVYSEAESLKVISSKLESLDLSLVSWYASYDYVTSIDASECPALTNLNANRSSKIKTLYLKTGQVIPKLTKNDATTIVYK